MTPVVPLGRHASTSPLLSQRYPIYTEPAELSNYTLSYIWDMSNILCIFMCTYECLVHVYTSMLSIMNYVGYFCNNIGLVLACLPGGTTGVTGSPSRYMTQPPGIPILSPILFMHVGDPYIPPF